MEAERSAAQGHEMVWIFLDDERVGLRVPAEWAARGSVFVPDRPRFEAAAAGVNPTFEPARPREYRKAWPERYEHVIGEDTTLKQGEPLGGEGSIVPPYFSALVFERVA